MTVVRRKIVTPTIKYVKISEHKEGDILVTGKYTEIREVDNFNKDGKVNLYLFKNEDGETVALNGNKKLDENMAEVKIGETVEISFQGKRPGVNKQGKRFNTNMFEIIVLDKKPPTT